MLVRLVGFGHTENMPFEVRFGFAYILQQSFVVLMLNKCFDDPRQGVKRPYSASFGLLLSNFM